MLREMPGMEWILDIGLVILLAATLFHAVRLERALGVLKRDRAALETLVATFNASTRAAESGVERLRAATDGAGRQIQRQIEAATSLKDDLTFLVQRGEGLADRMDELVRAARPLGGASLGGASLGGASLGAVPAGSPSGGSAAGEFLARHAAPMPVPAMAGAAEPVKARFPYFQPPRAADPAPAGEPRVRSQAERDLLKALRMAR